MTIKTYGTNCSLDPWLNKISVNLLKALFDIYKYAKAKFSIINRLSTSEVIEVVKHLSLKPKLNWIKFIFNFSR